MNPRSLLQAFKWRENREETRRLMSDLERIGKEMMRDLRAVQHDSKKAERPNG